MKPGMRLAPASSAGCCTLEIALKRSAFAIINVAYSPSRPPVHEDKDYVFWLAQVLKRNVDSGLALLVTWFANNEFLDVHVLRIIERIAVYDADFLFRGEYVFPNHVGQTFFEILVKQSATAGLEEGAVLPVMLAVEV